MLRVLYVGQWKRYGILLQIVKRYSLLYQFFIPGCLSNMGYCYKFLGDTPCNINSLFQVAFQTRLIVTGHLYTQPRTCKEFSNYYS